MRFTQFRLWMNQSKPKAAFNLNLYLCVYSWAMDELTYGHNRWLTICECNSADYYTYDDNAVLYLDVIRYVCTWNEWQRIPNLFNTYTRNTASKKILNWINDCKTTYSIRHIYMAACWQYRLMPWSYDTSSSRRNVLFIQMHAFCEFSLFLPFLIRSAFCFAIERNFCFW